MKKGDLVRWRPISCPRSWICPIGMIIDQRASDSEYHHRIRVIWLGNKIPINAKSLSTTGKRITSWVLPHNFEVLSESEV